MCVVVNEASMVSEKAAVCVHVQKGYEGLLSCVAGVCSRGVGTSVGWRRRWRMKRRSVLLEERGESCGAVSMCVRRHVKMENGLRLRE